MAVDKWTEVRRLEPWRDPLAEFIRAQREMRGWTQEDLADKAQLNVCLIDRLEHGRTNASLATLHRVARSFGVRELPVNP